MRPSLRFAAAVTGLLIAVASASADSLDTGFHDPPDSAKPQTWWHWMNGNVTREGITLDLEAMKRVGIGGAQIFNVDCGIPAGPVKLMSPEWRDLVRHAARETDRLGLELCIHNGAGWSSSGGPWNTPEHAMQRVTTSELRVKGPTHFHDELPLPPTKLNYYRDITVLAFPTPQSRQPLVIENIEAKGGFNGGFVDFTPPKTRPAPGRVVERSSILDLKLASDGRLDWNVPPGDWAILRVGYTPTGAENHPAPAEGRGLECDKFSKEALDGHWTGYVQKVMDDLGPLAGAGAALNNIVIDSYEVGGQNWTPQFRAEFMKRRGYDPVSWLPTLTGRVIDSPELSERFLWDMRRAIADLFADNYYGHFRELCHQHGLKASFEPYTGPFDSLQCGGRADIPMGEFWVGGEPDASVKLASSIGHVYGQRIIGAESFTGAPAAQHGRWLDDPSSLKTLGDQVFCRGINRFIFHRYAMQPWTNRWPGMTMGQWGTHFDRTSTWWEQGRGWLQYIARCQFLLQQGRFVADAAYFCGENAPVELRVGSPALPPGYDWDAIGAEALLQRAIVKEGCLAFDSGMEYRVLILPPSDRALRPALVRQLRRLVAGGLTVVGPPPQISPSLEDYPKCDAEVGRLVTELWGECDGQKVTEHRFGRGKVVWGRPMTQVFTELDLKPDFELLSGESGGLAFNHRRDHDSDIYFVSNQRKQFKTVDCAFRVTGKTPELWNPETGNTSPAPVWREQEGRTIVTLSLEPIGSVFVVFRSQAQADHLIAASCDEPRLLPVHVKLGKLRILKAVYGSFTEGHVNVTAKIKSLMADGARQIRAGNDLVDDDPAAGVVKRLRVEFLVEGRRQTALATEGEMLNLPVGGEVVEALYGDLPGDGSPNWIDVTAKVKAVVAGGAGQINAGNDLAGRDPSPNIPKKLVVDYRLSGQRKKVEISEGGTFDAPDGVEIVKALYGSSQSRKAGPDQTVDVTSKLARMIENGQLNVRADNNLAGYDPAEFVVKELRIDYSVDGAPKRATVQENEILILPEDASLVSSASAYGFDQGADSKMRLLSWEPRQFSLAWVSGRKTAWQCPSMPAPLSVSGPWDVSFPPGWKAPAKTTFDHLQSWTENGNPGVKYFSGTAAYHKEIEIPADWLNAGREIWLDLGVVKNFAEVSINGQPLGILWKPPFRVNVTKVARAGTNTVEIKVTNLWPNRLIGDEQLPSDCEWKGKELKAWPQWLVEGKPSPTGRVTFATWHHWHEDDALLDSGLIGPVTLRVAEEFDLP